MSTKGPFTIRTKDAILGTSELESRDREMGVARGLLLPSSGYSTVRPVFRMFADAQGTTGPPDMGRIREYYRARDALGLVVESADGTHLPSTVVHIEDYQEEGDDSSIEVEVHFSDGSLFPG